MSLDPTGQYLVADMFSEPSFTPELYLFDLKNGNKMVQFTDSHSLFWQGQKLMLQGMDENQWMLYEHNPKTNKKNLF